MYDKKASAEARAAIQKILDDGAVSKEHLAECLGYSSTHGLYLCLKNKSGVNTAKRRSIQEVWDLLQEGKEVPRMQLFQSAGSGNAVPTEEYMAYRARAEAAPSTPPSAPSASSSNLATACDLLLSALDELTLKDLQRYGPQSIIDMQRSIQSLRRAIK